MVMLGCIVEWNPQGIDVEADPRHIELILKEMNVESYKGSAVLGCARRDDEED